MKKRIDKIMTYKICKAQAEEWARYYCIYRVSNFNEWFSLSFQEEVDKYKRSEFCYWIVDNDNVKIGGAFIKPNMIKCIFVIPPYDKKKNLIDTIVLYAQSISDKNRGIIVPDVELEDIEHFKRYSFKLDRIQKLMICPTKKIQVTWKENFKVLTPKIQNREKIAELFYESYSNGNFEYNADTSYDSQLAGVQVYFNHIRRNNVPSEWSTLVYDTKSEKLVGACMVGLVNGLPYIIDFVVHSEFQGQKIGTKIMERTLNMFFNKYPYIRLNLIVGNDAESFYNKLGFIGLAKKAYMIN